MILEFLDKAGKESNLKIFHKILNKKPLLKLNNYLTYTIIQKLENKTIYGEKIEFECQLFYKNDQDNKSIIEIFESFYQKIDLNKCTIEKIDHFNLIIYGSFMYYGEILYV